jgi:hypothetical protein
MGVDIITIITAKSFEGDEAAIDYLAAHYKEGEIIPGTGGVRKLRVPLTGRGKSGGGRVIYYYYDDDCPVFAFSFYTKNQKSNLSKKEVNDLYKIIQKIKKEMK